jgi:predicted lactoylglutathione lyase
MKLPMPVPEIPVTDVRAAAEAYQRQMGFNVDWTYEDYLAGITKDDARLYLRRRTPEEDQARYAVLVWLNMASAAEVDELHARWTERGVRIVKELQTAPYGLREFTAEDLDGNRIRVFFVLGA